MTRIWAHRGASAYAPENTLAAFALAREMGAHGVELDVQMTADGRIVVIHDETLDRTTDGTGPVGWHTLDELKALDASAGMIPFSGEKIPTLDEVFELLDGSGMVVNVELKNSVVAYPGLEEAVLALVPATGVVLSTFNHLSLAALVGLGACDVGMLFGDVLFEPWRYGAGIGVQALHPPFAYLDAVPDTVDQCHDAGLAVNAWTLNDTADLRRLIDLGIDAAITNYPDRALALL